MFEGNRLLNVSSKCLLYIQYTYNMTQHLDRFLWLLLWEQGLTLSAFPAPHPTPLKLWLSTAPVTHGSSLKAFAIQPDSALSRTALSLSWKSLILLIWFYSCFFWKIFYLILVFFHHLSFLKIQRGNRISINVHGIL